MVKKKTGGTGKVSGSVVSGVVGVTFDGDPRIVGYVSSVVPTVDPDLIPVHRGDQIQWTNPFRVPVTVHLQRAPVTPTEVIVQPGETGTAVVLKEAMRGLYKYDVTLEGGGKTITVDPYIDVQEEENGDT